ncbi:carbohydrate ABC transporter permease [Homoserinibacter sp. GY 40078]|uniref:carbohydrate ABC transporter permease n=1 Tax=Homoserinibacter sp. GY 40078 TaxID=2603275 RepID=UPI0011C8953F|nr:carbohydrate ABC transporter permease [Homoserinibacter sp. GY 40078]TXK18772.1 carbohydrate ABC transporter permease [Homoserinibacter sp. GY 40078]
MTSLNSRVRWPIFLLLVLMAATIIYPLFFLVSSSLRTNSDYLNNPLGLPSSISFENFVVIWNTYGAGPAFLNSLYVVTIAMIITILLSTSAGYALAKLPVPGAKLITGSFVSVMLIPGQVLILPIYLMLSRLGLVGDFSGLIVVYVATSLPFAVFFLSVSFRAIPDELLEAIRLDGAGFFRTIRSLILPVGGSSIATLAVLQFLGMWNELLYAFILLPDDSKRLLTPALAQIGDRYLNQQPLVSAGLLLTASVPILLLVLASRYVMQGLAAGVSR